MKTFFSYLLLYIPLYLSAQNQAPQDFLSSVSHHYVENGDVKLHYVSVGEGPLVVMLHGFPDYWYTWRDQMNALKDQFRVVAMDLRGYNLSGQPEGVEAYQMKNLISDVVALIEAQEDEKAILVGHDWGGAIAWQVALRHPDLISKLIVCNMTHPTGYSQASYNSLKANANTSYMDNFRKHTSETLSITWLSGWVKDAEAKKYYEEAFKRSSIDGMVNYYRANSPTKEQREVWLANPTFPDLPKAQMPVLAIFGTQDQFVPKEGLNNTWDWMAQDFTLVTIPSAAHFVQQDASEMVSKSMRMWLLRDQLEIEPQVEGLSGLSWLKGKWQRTKGTSTIYEEWKQLSSGVFEGRSWKESSENGEKKHLEDLLLTYMGGEVFYMPKVGENAMPIPFKLTKEGKKEYEFSNPQHDFPQKIRYMLQEDGQLKVTISDMEETQSIDFFFQKAK